MNVHDRGESGRGPVVRWGGAGVLHGRGVEGCVGPFVVRVAPAPAGVDDGGEEEKRDGTDGEAKGPGGECALHGRVRR